MKPRVYVETSVVSYLAAPISSELVVAAHQQVTHEWWADRHRFELYISEPVVEEAEKGNREKAGKRLELLAGIPVLEASSEALALASRLLHQAAVPSKAYVDAVHISIAAVHGLDFLVTWNCKHIANAIMLPRIVSVCRVAGFEPPVICTPDQLGYEVEIVSEDPIVKEIHEIRDQIAKECDYDLGKIFEHFQSRERNSGRKVVSLSPRTPEKTGQESNDAA